MPEKVFFRKIVEYSRLLREVLERAKLAGVDSYYIGAGFVAQTVWNRTFGYAPLHGIKDLDFAYFDPADTSAEAEQELEKRLNLLYSAWPFPADAKNQARVHLWYEKRFGYPIAPYQNLEAAIATWPTTATAVGLRLNQAGELEVCAPFGVEDLIHGIVRPNKAQITRGIYEAKTARWKALWPELIILDWDEAEHPVFAGDC